VPVRTGAPPCASSFSGVSCTCSPHLTTEPAGSRLGPPATFGASASCSLPPMGEKSLPSGHAKKPGRSLKEKRQVKKAKKEAQSKSRQGWTEGK